MEREVHVHVKLLKSPWEKPTKKSQRKTLLHQFLLIVLDSERGFSQNPQRKWQLAPDPLRRACSTPSAPPPSAQRPTTLELPPCSPGISICATSQPEAPPPHAWGRRRRTGGRTLWVSSATSGFRLTSTRVKRRSRSEYCITRAGSTRFTRCVGRMELEPKWTRWIWRERKGLLYNPQLRTVLGRIIRFLLHQTLFNCWRKSRYTDR